MFLPSHKRLALFGSTIFRIQCHSLHMSNRGNKSRNTRRKRWAYTCKWIFTHINKYNIVYEPILSFLFISRLLHLERMWHGKKILNKLQSKYELKEITYRQFETQVRTIKQCCTFYLGLEATKQNSQILQDGIVISFNKYMFSLQSRTSINSSWYFPCLFPLRTQECPINIPWSPYLNIWARILAPSPKSEACD